MKQNETVYESKSRQTTYAWKTIDFYFQTVEDYPIHSATRSI